MRLRITAEGSTEEFDGMTPEQIVIECNKHNDQHFKVVAVEILDLEGK